MKFQFDNRRYSISFERAFKQVAVVTERGKTETVRSKYPYTTVILYEYTTTTPVTLLKATVGCAATDSYSNEKGRLYALRALNDLMRKRIQFTEEFRRALWTAYMTRGQQQERAVVDAVVVTSETVH